MCLGGAGAGGGLEAVGAVSTKKPSTMAATGGALGGVSRALENEQKTDGAFSGRCFELQARVDETIAALFEQRAAGEDGAAFL